MAKLIFHYSSMSAGKTAQLLVAAHNYASRGMETLLFTPSMDTRSGEGRIASRMGLSAPAVSFKADDNLFTMAANINSGTPLACIFVDEAQFLHEVQVFQLAEVVDVLDIPVMTYGLRVDFQGRLFPGSMALLALAQDLRHIRTVCWCGRLATMVARQDNSGKTLTEGSQIEIGDAQYSALCRKHWSAEWATVGGLPPYTVAPTKPAFPK